MEDSQARVSVSPVSGVRCARSTRHDGKCECVVCSAFCRRDCRHCIVSQGFRCQLITELKAAIARSPKVWIFNLPTSKWRYKVAPAVKLTGDRERYQSVHYHGKRVADHLRVRFQTTRMNTRQCLQRFSVARCMCIVALPIHGRRIFRGRASKSLLYKRKKMFAPTMG